MRSWVAVFALLFSGCYAEFDNGFTVPRRDPCTGLVTYSRVHAFPTCRNAPIPIPNYPYP